jgi:hypothetical protein
MTFYSISFRNKAGVWLIFAILFSLWLALLVTSPNPIHFPDILLLAVMCAIVPTLAHFIYVAVDHDAISVPRALFFRRSIPIRSIRGLHFQSSALGLVKGIQIQYRDDQKVSRTAIMPSLTTFGTRQTAEIIATLKRVNPAIEIDPRITAMLP